MKNLPAIEEMLKAGLHFGHRTSKWHPKMKPYIFGSRNGVHIIDLIKSQSLLDEALAVIEKAVKEDKTVLFVGTKAQVKKPLKEMAEATGMPYVTEKWLGGLLTNFTVIRKLIRKYADLQEAKKSGKLDKYTKKERLEIDREIAKLDLRVGGLSALTKNPDMIFIWDIKTERTALEEANKKNIPVIAICDTNVNPTTVKHVIPCNDDATKGIKLILASIGETIKEAKKSKAN
jgi:small subunit ribosomal protein S2